MQGNINSNRFYLSGTEPRYNHTLTARPGRGYVEKKTLKTIFERRK